MRAPPRRLADLDLPSPPLRSNRMLTRGSAPRPPGGNPLRGFRPILPSLRFGRMVETARANQRKAAFAAFFHARYQNP